MYEWLEWARGPVFRMCLMIMLLGLGRVVALNLWQILSYIRTAKKNNREVPFGTVARMTLQWILPLTKGIEQRAYYSVVSMLFHVCIIITPILLGAHVLLWERGIGFGWPTISNLVADYLTLGAIVTGVVLLAQRAGSKASRALSRPQDYLLPLLIIIPFASGYLAMHPRINPFEYSATMFVHVMSGNLILLLMPFTKISHVVLFPATQLISELGWHLAPGAGEKVAAALGKENEPI